MQQILPWLAWFAITLDILASIGMLFIFGILAAMCWDSDRRATVFIVLVGLTLAGHPLLSVRWALAESYGWALSFSGICALVSVGIAVITAGGVEAAARP